jgi:outer membrane protein assembly factor BamD (BamD/ComL family)
MGLLGVAQTAIQRGDYVSALAKLDEHQRSFPSGLLAEERTAARVVALCGANRQAEARALAATFLKQHPTSPLAPRVKSACEQN